MMAVTLGVLVTIHEFGHFWVARRCDVKVLRFSVGFGKPLFSWHDRSGTEYAVAAIPLGGYVKMLDEREGEVAEHELHRAFNRKPVLQRIAIVSAGPIANFLLAIAVYWALFVSGVTGVVPIIGAVTPGSIAEQAGLEEGQEVVSVDGVETPTWSALSMQLLDRIGESGPIEFAVRYPGSDLVYHSGAQLQNWLAGAEEPDLLAGIGIMPFRPLVEARIDQVVPDSPAAQAGLLHGDLIVAADGHPIADWEEWVDWVRARPEQQIKLQFERDGVPLNAVITPLRIEAEDGTAIGQVGVSVLYPELPPDMIRRHEYGLLAAWVPALQKTWQLTAFSLDSLKKMLMGLISPKNLSGPITIAKVAGASAKSGLESYLGFLALLSVSLGVLNLLPIPVLDGGHLLFYVVELVKGSPVAERIQTLGYQVGFSLILGIMLLALYNDISRL